MSKHILIVEDNELNLKLFKDLLSAHGYQTTEVTEGVKAYDTIKEKKPDLIIMDIQLPEVSGIDVTKRLKADAELKSIPVIAVTAFAMKNDEEKILNAGCEAYISKPIQIGTFLETINRFLNDENTD